MNDPVNVYPNVSNQSPASLVADPSVPQMPVLPNGQSQVPNTQSQIPEIARPGAMPQMFSQVVADQAGQLLDDQQFVEPTYPTGKEQAPNASHEMGYDVISGQPVEIEHSAEISPEVEKFIEEVQENDGQTPHEVVVADSTTAQPTGHYVSKPVIVLPLTKQELEQGKKASPLMSKRWLAEWVEKIMKMFEGSVVYKEE